MSSTRTCTPCCLHESAPASFDFRPLKDGEMLDLGFGAFFRIGLRASAEWKTIEHDGL